MDLILSITVCCVTMKIHMAILPIQTELKERNKILRAMSQEVKDIGDPRIQKLIGDMHETLENTENGVGLATPQVGKNLRMFVASPALELAQTVFINPVIVKISKETDSMEEGCLSVPGKYGKTRRATSLKVEAYNEHGKKFKLKAEGLIAQLVQHEMGHLDGELFIDKAKNIKTHS